MTQVKQFVSVKDFVAHFNFEQVTGDEASLKRKIEVRNTNRPGLELTGYYDHVEKKRIVIIGNKETAYITRLSPEVQRERFDFITHHITPLILITGGNPCSQVLFDLATEKNFPIFSTPISSSEIMVDVVTYLNDIIAPSTNLHGVLMNVFGKGVLIIGESGMGKSEIALELITMGHSLVADDRVDVRRIKNGVIGHAPKLLAGMLEIRGIGIIDVMSMFGVGAFLEQESIDFVVEFKPWDPQAQYMRAGIEDELKLNLLGVEIPHLIFPVKEGRSLAVLVESAVRNFLLRQRGIHAAEIFDERVKDFIKEQSEDMQE